MKKVIDIILALFFNLTSPIILTLFLLRAIEFYNQGNQKYFVYVGLAPGLIIYQLILLNKLIYMGPFFYKKNKTYQKMFGTFFDHQE